MSSIERALKNFIQTTKKYPRVSPVIKTGELYYRSNLPDLEINKEIHLSPELEYFYKNCEIICDVRHDGYQLDGIGIDFGDINLYLYSPDNLERRQEGFRWIGIGKNENPNWDPNWLVFADKDDDPIVVATDQEDSPVLASYETSELFPIADSFSDFLDSLSVALVIVHENFAGEIMDEETFEVYDDFIVMLKSSLINILKKEEYVDNLINYLYIG
ncbi:SMI1/KNR4 family protein [Lysinibacillus sp. NPDC048646]|uniref:SMI1/KNR4 family protein n=1 Tax=Lysinibacillus sp. NPDC048646 TaxID=3390574 RepID=UPI003CFC6F9A